MNESTDYYAILGVPADANPAMLKQAYRTLARRWHPDRQPGDPAAAAHFRSITAAYQTLRQPQERAWYDAARQAARECRPPARQASTGPMAPSSTMGDLLATLFAHLSAPFPFGGTTGGTVLPMTLSLEEAFWGTTRRVQVGQERISVAVPCGVATGDCFQVNPTGAASQRAERMHPIILRVLVLPHPHYQRHGDDLWVLLQLDPRVAREGGSLRVPLLDRSIIMTMRPVPGGEMVVRVQHGGMPHRGAPARRGDLYVQLCSEASSERDHPAGATVRWRDRWG